MGKNILPYKDSTISSLPTPAENISQKRQLQIWPKQFTIMVIPLELKNTVSSASFPSFVSIFYSYSNLLLPWEMGVQRVGSSLHKTPMPVLLLTEVLGFFGWKDKSLSLCRKLRDSAFILKWDNNLGHKTLLHWWLNSFWKTKIFIYKRFKNEDLESKESYNTPYKRI